MHEKQLLDYLKGACLGRAYRVGSAELERALGVSSTDLRKIVNRLRRRGIPIASDRPRLPARSTLPSINFGRWQMVWRPLSGGWSNPWIALARAVIPPEQFYELGGREESSPGGSSEAISPVL